jgi:hypothetical protein
VRFTRWRAGDHIVSPPAHDGPDEEGNGEKDGGRQKGDAQYAGSDQEDEHEAFDNEVSGKAHLGTEPGAEKAVTNLIVGPKWSKPCSCPRMWSSNAWKLEGRLRALKDVELGRMYFINDKTDEANICHSRSGERGFH